VDGDAAADQAAHLVALAQQLQREGEDGLDLGGVRLQGELAGVGDGADERVDAVAGDEGRDRGQRAGQADRGGVESDLLLGLAQRRRRQVGVARVLAAAGEGDLAGVPPQVGAALGEDQPRLVGPAVEGKEDRRVGAAPRLDRRRLLGGQQPLGEVAQTITWTVPPSTDQAAPAT
jgi:hypothetical protein